jgi:hypothetical protein
MGGFRRGAMLALANCTPPVGRSEWGWTSVPSRGRIAIMATLWQIWQALQ